MLSPAVSQDLRQLVSLDASEPRLGTKTVLFGQDAEALGRLMATAGEPGWRARQLAEAIYRQWLTEIEGVTTWPKALRSRLVKDGWAIGRPRIAQIFQSTDGTERYLVEGQPTAQRGDGPADTVETVWMPEGDGAEAGDETEGEESTSPDRAGKNWDRATICVSSQVGCAVNCQFCLTARLGLQRNLTAGEIAGQVIAVLDRHKVEIGRDRINLVFMGMGEPFLNYDNFMAAVRLLVNEVGMSSQRMTVSTSGIVPGIERFALEPAEIRPRLAISLNAPNNEIRGEVMPINRKWPIEAVIDAVKGIGLRSRERITFEYVLLGGVTDRPEHARQVAKLVHRSGLPAKVNLIAWNPGPGVPYATPAPDRVEAFRARLAGEGIPTYLRRPRGRDIYAACGQLKRTVEG